jgi:hypothetical protein
MKGFLLFLASLLAYVLVPFYAIKGKYPWWMVTPDDPVSPFGQYEESIRKAYKWGRWWGDTRWLTRNAFYGLKYRFKPDALKGVTDYSNLTTIRHKEDVYLFLDEVYVEKNRRFGPFVLITGYRLSPIHNDKNIPRKEINMDGRPVFSIRTRRTS